MLQLFRPIISLNPTTAQFLKSFDFISNEELHQKIQNSQLGYLKQLETSTEEKEKKLMKLADVLNSNITKLSSLITTEIGKPITQSINEIKKCIFQCEHYAKFGKDYLKPTSIQTEAKEILVQYEPLGTIYALIPFNFPVWLLFRMGIPNLFLGNSLLIRMADSTPQLALEIEKAFQEAGYDSHEVQNVFSSPEQSETILKNDIIKGISFIGSTKAGKNLASIAGKCMKKSAMELGGSDPFLVLQDADVDYAVQIAINSRIANAGQICFCAKRFICHHSVYEDFKNKLIAKLNTLVIGNPFLETTNMGPLAREDLLVNLEYQVQKAINQGAKHIYGGKRIAIKDFDKGYFFQPGIFELNNLDNIFMKEEIFGPIFPLLKAENEDEMINIANQTDYGLGAVIISKNEEKAKNLATKIQAGMVFINEIVKSDPRYPSGGIKMSGYGRDCSEFGCKEFANAKTIYIH